MNFQTGILPAIAVVSLGAVMATLPALRPEPAQGPFAKLTSYPEQPRTPEASSVRLASYSAPAKPSSSAYTAHSLRAVSGVQTPCRRPMVKRRVRPAARYCTK